MTKFHLLIGLVLLFQINTLLANNHKSLHDKSIQYQQNFIGLSQNYFSQSGPSIFFSFHDHDPAFGNSNFHTHTFFDPFTDAKETIITTSIEAQFYLIDQIAFGFKLPIHKHQRIYKDEIIKVTGLGDLMINTLYHFYNSKNFNPNEKVNHLLTGFFQVQIPTGIYRQADILNDIEPHIQNGTGSFNYDIMLEYKMDYNKWRFNLSSIYHLNQKNYYQFKVGNSIVSQLLATYNLSFNSIDVAISTGLDYRKKQTDVLENESISEPNEFKGFGSMSKLNLSINKVQIYIDWLQPIAYKYDDLSMQHNTNIEFKLQYLF